MPAKLYPLLYCAAAGLLSGLIAAAGPYILPDIQIVQRYYPAVIFAVALYLSGALLLGIRTGKPLLNLPVLIIFTALGWKISMDTGFALGGPAPYALAGTLGAFIVAWGWLLAWGLPGRDWKFLVTVSLAGMLGGLAFQVLDALWSMRQPLWALVLFSEWQCLVLGAIAFAHQKLADITPARP